MSRRAPGEGSVYFDSNRSRWVGAVTVSPDPMNGRRRRVKVVGKAGEGKRSVASRLRAKAAELEALVGPPATVGDLVAQWRTRAAPKRRSPTTLAMTDSLIRNHIEPVLGSVPVSQLTVDTVEAFLDARVASLSKSTLTKLRAILAQALDYGIRRRQVVWNPARMAELPPDSTPTREPRALTAAEARDLISLVTEPRLREGELLAPPRLGAWVVVAMTLGLRPGEASGLAWEAIDFHRGTVTIYQALSWPKGGPVLKETKSKRSRTLELPRIARDALLAHEDRSIEERHLMTGRWPTGWESLVFVSEDGTPIDPSNLRRLLARWAREAGIEGDVTPYDLRHTATSLISAGGLSAERLADLLGHRDTRMVFGHYRHPVTSSVSTAAEFWNRGEPIGEPTKKRIDLEEVAARH